MNRKFLVTYAFDGFSGMGYGNAFMTITRPRRLTETVVREWWVMIQREHGFRSVNILSITELEG